MDIKVIESKADFIAFTHEQKITWSEGANDGVLVEILGPDRSGAMEVRVLRNNVLIALMDLGEMLSWAAESEIPRCPECGNGLHALSSPGYICDAVGCGRHFVDSAEAL